MGWRTACVLVGEREGGFLGTFPAHLPGRARRLLSDLGLDAGAASKPSDFDAGLEPPPDWFCVGAYEGAALVCGHPELYGLVESPRKPFLARCLSLSPGAQVLFCELDEGTSFVAYALYERGRLLRALACDPDRGVVVNEGEVLPEEASILRTASSAAGRGGPGAGGASDAELCDAAESLLFALTGRFLGPPLNEFPAEKLPVELFKLKMSWRDRLGL